MDATEVYVCYVRCKNGHGLRMLGGPDQFGRMVFLNPGPCAGCLSLPTPKPDKVKLSWRERREAKRIFRRLNSDGEGYGDL